MKINLFQLAWTEHKKLLQKSIKELQELMVEAQKSDNIYDHIRLMGKLEGLTVMYERMRDSEKIYGLCLHENAIIDDPWDNRNMYCPDCDTKLYDMRF